MAYVFRTILTYDCEKHAGKETFTQSSLTDPSEYESLEQILARCMRGDMSRVIQGNNDGFDDKATDEEIINSMAPQDRSDFDIADQTDIILKAEQSLKSLKKKEKKGAKAPESSTLEKSKEQTGEVNGENDNGSAT